MGCFLDDGFPEVSVGVVEVGAEAGVADELSADDGAAGVDVIDFDLAADAFGSVGVLLVEVDEIVLHVVGAGFGIEVGVQGGVVVEEIDEAIINELQGIVSLGVAYDRLAVVVIERTCIFGDKVVRDAAGLGIEHNPPGIGSPWDVDALADDGQVLGTGARSDDIEMIVVAQVFF